MPYQPKTLVGVNIEPRPILADITVVIPTLGRPILEESIYWIVSGSTWPGRVIVVDQSSSQQVAAWIALLQSIGIKAEHVPSSQRGRAAGVNRGLERIKTRFVALTDDDCFVNHDWLEKMVGHLRQRPKAIITGRVELAGDDEVAFSVVTSREPNVYVRPQLKVHPFIGGNVGLTMELVERIGLFDEHPCLQSAEDSDYGYRALRLGIPIIYDPDIALRHYHWRDASLRTARYADYARSQGGFYGTHLLNGDWLILLQATRDLVRGPVRWLRGIIKRDQHVIDRGRADTLNLLPGIIAGLRREKIPEKTVYAR